MPTPIGHSLAATAMQLGNRRPLLASGWASTALLVFLANLPDVDFIPGYFVGSPRQFHWGPTHSLTAALIVGCVVGWIVRSFGGNFGRAFLLATAAYASHIGLDLLLGSGNPSIGIQVFWPFSTQRYMASLQLFEMFPDSIERIGPVRALFTVDILPVIGRELVVLIPIVLLAWALRRSAPLRDV